MTSVRELHPKLQQMAIEELNEDPKRIPEDLTHIKDWLSKQPHINPRNDDQLLLSFLRGSKFSLERAKHNLDMYYTAKSSAPEYYRNLDPFLPGIQQVLSFGRVRHFSDTAYRILVPLAKAADPAAPRYLLGRSNSNLNLEDVSRASVMVNEVLLKEDDNVVVSGIHFAQDVTNISLGSALVKRGLMAYLKSCPIRVKGYHVVNSNSVFDAVSKIFSPFFTPKFKSRVTVSSTLSGMHEHFPVEVIPDEFGGAGGKLEDIVAEWKSKIESYREWFLEGDKYGVDESKRQGSRADFGIDGSFRQLSLD